MRFRPIVVLFVVAAFAVRAAEEAPAPKSSARDALRARMAEDAKKKAATPTPPTKATKADEKEESPASAAQPAKDAPQKTVAQQPPTVLPKVEVKKGRITELDQKLAQQEQEIAREKKNLKTTEADRALNDAKIAKPLSIFGGESAQFRKRVASERVELMEMEKDIIEAIARTKSKKEKEELEKQLDQIRAMRRDLDKSLR